MVPNSGAPTAMLQNIAIDWVFATLAPQKPSKMSILAILGPTMSATPQFGVKIRPNQAKCGQYLGPDEARKCKIPLSSHKVLRIMRAKAKKTPMCSASLIAIKLKGLAAPGEALKNMKNRLSN